MTGARQQRVRPTFKARALCYLNGTLAWSERVVGINERASVTKAIATPSGAVGGDGAVADLGRLQISSHVATDALMRVAETPRRRTVEGAAADSASLCPTPFDKKSASAVVVVASRLAFMSAGQLDTSLVRTAVNSIGTSIRNTQLCDCPARRRCF